MARLSRAAFQVYCLGTAGGCLGAAVGGVVGYLVLLTLTHNAFLAFPGVLIGAVLGVVVSIWLTLTWMSK